MPEASTRVPPELSCQTEEKNRCRPREIIVFVDVNRIGPKNPYRGKDIRPGGGVPRNPTYRQRIPERPNLCFVVGYQGDDFQPLSQGFVSRSMIFFHGDRFSLVETRRKEACSLVFLSSSRFAD